MTKLDQSTQAAIYSCGLLKSQAEIREAHELLYNIYVKELFWDIAPENPSGIQVLKDKDRFYLFDQFENVSSWIGVKVNGLLVATLRILERQTSEPQLGRFELELYQKLPDFIHSEAKCCEINRLAVRADHIERQALPLLLKTAFEFCIDNNIRLIFSSVQFPKPGEFFISLGMEKAPNSDFTYTSLDPHSVSILYYDLTNKHKTSESLRVLSSIV